MINHQQKKDNALRHYLIDQYIVLLSISKIIAQRLALHTVYRHVVSSDLF